MRTLLKITMPVEHGNKAVKDGSLSRIMQSLIQELKPESSYFYPERGRRTAIFVFDLKDPTQIPQVAEPLFEKLCAEVELFPVMNADELRAGLEKTTKKHHDREPARA
jgi:hypothetical protein